MADGTQIAVRLDPDVLAELDGLVATGQFSSRAEAVRHAIAVVLDARRRSAVGAAIVEGYRRTPQSEADDEVAEANLARLVAEERW